MRVRSFFSVKSGVIYGKICLQGSFKRVFERILHCGARGDSEVYAERILASEPDGLNFLRVRIPPCAKRRIASGLDCPSGHPEERYTKSCTEMFFIFDNRYHSAKGKCHGTSPGAMQK